MNKNIHLYLSLILTAFVMIISFSAVSVLADSSVRITRPTNNSKVKPGSVAVWTSFDQPSSYSADEIAREYTPVQYKIYKDGELYAEQSVYQEQLNFTAEGSYSVSFTLSSEGTYTIQASVPKTAGEWDFVTFEVANEDDFDGPDESDDSDYSFESVNSENAAILSEGKPVQCTLTKAGNFMAAYKVTPSESGYYVFFAAGADSKISGELYEGVGDTSGLDLSERSDEDNRDSFCFIDYLSEGKSYTLLIRSTVQEEDKVFGVGFVSKDSGKKVASASEIALTEADRNYTFGVCSGSRIPDAEWVISDHSVVDYSSSSSFSQGMPDYAKYYNMSTIKLEARKNGSATVSLVDSNTDEVYASCRINCSGFAEKNESDEKESQSDSSDSGNPSGDGNESGGSPSEDGNGSGSNPPSGTEKESLPDPEEKTAADVVAAKVKKIPSVSKLTAADESLVTDAYESYKALSKTEKATLPKGTDTKIEKARKQIKILKAEEKDKNSIKNREEKILADKSDKDLDKSTFAPLKLKAAASTQSSITLSWSKVDGAAGYIVYGNMSGKTYKMKRLTAPTKTKLTIKAIGEKPLKKGKYYKFLVLAYKTVDGYKKCKATSGVIHIATTGGTVTNVKQVKPKVIKKTLKKGNTWTIKVSTVKKDGKKSISKFLGLRYESSDKTVAAVSSKGKVTAKKPGKATIYVYTQNGISASVTVTVKAK